MQFLSISQKNNHCHVEVSYLIPINILCCGPQKAYLFRAFHPVLTAEQNQEIDQEAAQRNGIPDAEFYSSCY